MHNTRNETRTVNLSIHTCTVTPPLVFSHGHSFGPAHNGIQSAGFGEAFAAQRGDGLASTVDSRLMDWRTCLLTVPTSDVAESGAQK